MSRRSIVSVMLSLTLASASSGAQPRAPEAASVDSAINLGRVFSDVASRALPAVVTLYVEVTRRSDRMLYDTPGFWGVAPQETQRRHGSGSGVLIREDGVIVTNHHVVEGATRILVHLRDGRTFSGRVLGSDPSADLAVVKIDAQGLPTAGFADSDAARVGEWVLAIGAPFGLEASVTHGVISATGRGSLGMNEVEDYLQTDASINPGNSGGALVNLRGEVLGINTLIVGRGQGIGFAVSSRLVQQVVRQVLATGRVTRGWTGFDTQDITPDLSSLGSPGGGALVSRVAPDSPAAAAGLRPSDVIVAVDGREVHGRNDMRRLLATRAPGERVVLTTRREDRRREVTLTTALRPGEAPPGPPPPPPPPEPGPTGFGITIEAVPPAYAARMGLGPDGGVAIMAVQRGGAADRAGLRPGDVILEADRRPARGTDDVVAAARDGRAVFLVRRGASQEYVGLAIGNTR
ncbi:MAG: trypsin-like peptidase domain-containing protein [Deltaproteobacteria bacterium]|nr:trypsin-like peptidase domain-containing protein [Deltaproteobacteria bacterium]